MMAKNSPFSTEKETPSSARTWFAPSPYTFVSCSIFSSSMGFASCCFGDEQSIAGESDSSVTF